MRQVKGEGLPEAEVVDTEVEVEGVVVVEVEVGMQGVAKFRPPNDEISLAPPN